MGKKAKTKKGEQRAQERKVDKSEIPPPPPPLEEEIGSSRLLSEPKSPGSRFKVLDGDGYDDGGVGDLSLVLDLDDLVLRRKRGELAYFSAVKADVLPRITTGPMATRTRRDQKVHLASLLFSEGDNNQVQDDEDNTTPSEVYVEVSRDDPQKQARREERLKTAKTGLRFSLYLCEPACAAVSLSEISKRTLLLKGKEGAEVALRCADKALEMASDGYYDNDEIAVEAEDEPKLNLNHEKNATHPGLSHPTSLKYFPKRLSMICRRNAYLNRGNALSALGRDAEARESYERELEVLKGEPRSARIDWERTSALVNIGNTYSRQGNFEKADVYYKKAEQIGMDHFEAENGSKVEGMGIRMVAMRARAFALKKHGEEEKAKTLLRDVLDIQIKFNELMQEEKEIMKAELKKNEENGVSVL